jgi:hypothetical protein
MDKNVCHSLKNEGSCSMRNNRFLRISRQLSAAWLERLYSGSLCFLLFLTSVGYTNPEDSPTQKNDIKGYVVDGDNDEPLPYANVVLKGGNMGATTNTDGYFIIVNAPVGVCTLEVYYVGYATQRIVIQNVKGKSTVQKVFKEKSVEALPESDDEKNNDVLKEIERAILKEQALYKENFQEATEDEDAPEVHSELLFIKMQLGVVEGKGVTVVAEEYKMWKRAGEVSQITFSPQQISALPSFGEVDIFRSLQLLPGISGVNDGSAGLYVRGGTPDQNLVLLDGMTVYHVDHFFGFFSAFNADAVKDVQVYKGGFPAKFGGRLSSVVELTGKNGDTNKTRFGFGVNLLSANALFELPLFSNKGSWIISARRSYTDIIQSGLYNNIFDSITDGEATTTPGPGSGGGGRRGQVQQETRPDFYFYDVNSKLSYSPNKTNTFALSFYNGKDNLHDFQEIGGLKFAQLDSLQSVATGSRGRDEKTDWGNLGASFKWSHRLHDRFTTNLLFAGSNYFSEHTTDLSFNIEGEDSSIVFRGGRTFASQEDNEIKDLTFRIDNEWHPSNAHRVGFGVWISQTGTDYTATINDSTSVLDSHENSRQSTFYLQDKWKMFNPLELSLGLRGTHYDQTESFYFEPRASFQLALTDQFKLKGAWGQYNQFIHRIVNEDVLEGSRDFWLVADENLKPSFSEHYVLGFGYENRKYLFEVEAYHKNMDDLIEFSRRFQQGADFGGLFFFGSGFSRGIEFLAQKKSGALSGWVSYTLGDIEHTFPNLNNGEPFPASHDRTHELKFVGIYALNRHWNFAATWVFASGQPYTSPEGQYYIDLLNGTTQSYYHVGDKNANFLPDYHRLDISASYKLALKEEHNWDGEIGLSIFNLYNHTNVWYRKYDLEVTPIVITDVTTLGFTPTIYLKANF